MSEPAAADNAVPLPLISPVMVVVNVIAGVVDAVATVPANPLADTTEAVVTVPDAGVVQAYPVAVPLTAKTWLAVPIPSWPKAEVDVA
jgi:hypothetical protein